MENLKVVLLIAWITFPFSIQAQTGEKKSAPKNVTLMSLIDSIESLHLADYAPHLYNKIHPLPH